MPLPPVSASPPVRGDLREVVFVIGRRRLARSKRGTECGTRVYNKAYLADSERFSDAIGAARGIRTPGPSRMRWSPDDVWEALKQPQAMHSK